MSNTIEGVKKADERTVDTLQRFYAIVIGLALTTGVKVLIESIGIVSGDVAQNTALNTTKPTVIFVFMAFLFTIIVFYHGMNRHLDETYILGKEPDQRRLPMLIDIFVFVFESGLLFVMASTINKPRTFLIFWSALLMLDIVWTFTVCLIQRRKPIWIWNNLVFLVIAWICWKGLLPQNAVCIAIVEAARSVTDYYINWDLYFPNETARNVKLVESSASAA